MGGAESIPFVLRSIREILFRQKWVQEIARFEKHCNKGIIYFSLVLMRTNISTFKKDKNHFGQLN